MYRIGVCIFKVYIRKKTDARTAPNLLFVRIRVGMCECMRARGRACNMKIDQTIFDTKMKLMS